MCALDNAEFHVCSRWTDIMDNDSFIWRLDHVFFVNDAQDGFAVIMY